MNGPTARRAVAYAPAWARRIRDGAGRLSAAPLPTLAVKSGLAAAVSWKLGTLLPGALPQHAYYAALGAVSVMYLALADSLIEAVRVVVAIVLGVGIACLVTLPWSAGAVTVGLAIAVGAMFGAVRWFGAQVAWVPLAALFALTASGGSTVTFSIDYVVQVSLGALVGLVVNALVLPSLALYDVDRQVLRVRNTLLVQLDRMQDALRREDRPEQGEWGGRLAELSPEREQLRALVRRAHRAQRANPRARRRMWRSRQESVLLLADGLQRLSWQVEDVSIGLYESQRVGTPGADPDLAQRTASALDLLAEAMRHPVRGVLVPHGDRVEAAEDGIEQVIEYALHQSSLPRDDRLLAVATALKVRDCLRTLETMDR